MSRVNLIVAVGLLTQVGCTLVNDVDPCKAKPKEVRYSVSSPALELVGHPQSAVQLRDGRILALYEENDLAGSSTLRMVAMNPNTGGRPDVCGAEPYLTLSPSFATRGTLVAADFDRLGTRIVAAVAWTSGTTYFSRKVHYQLIGADLCPFMPAGGVPLAPGLDVPTDDVALSWSESEQAVWATFHDTRNVYRSRLVGEVADAPQVIVQGQLLIDNFRAIFAKDGRGFAAWFASDSPLDFLNDRRHLRAVLLGPGAEPRTAAATAAPTAFELAIPTPFRAPDLNNALALAARVDRYALAFHGVVEPATRPIAHVLELDASDGRPRSAAWRVDPNTGEGHGRPSLAYLPDDNVLVAWSSASGEGVVAQLFRSGGVPRFSGVNCSESRFAVGTRTPEDNRGLSSVFSANDNAWVLHPGEPGGDHAALAWWVPYAELWPTGD